MVLEHYLVNIKSIKKLLEMLYTALIGSNGSEEKQQTHLPVTQKIAGVAPVGTANIGELALIG